MPIARATLTAIELFLSRRERIAGQCLRLDISVYVNDALGMNINLKSVAAEFGVSAEKLLYLYKTRGLPGQIDQVGGPRFYEEQDASEPDLDFDLTRLQKSWAWKRIERAARFSEETVQQFMTKSIMEAVRCLEDDMILSPKTGEPVCASYDLDEFLDATA
jgi:hypothetical protein